MYRKYVAEWWSRKQAPIVSYNYLIREGILPWIPSEILYVLWLPVYLKSDILLRTLQYYIDKLGVV